jgi:hypothetical protein
LPVKNVVQPTQTSAPRQQTHDRIIAGKGSEIK